MRSARSSEIVQIDKLDPTNKEEGCKLFIFSCNHVFAKSLQHAHVCVVHAKSVFATPQYRTTYSLPVTNSETTNHSTPAECGRPPHLGLPTQFIIHYLSVTVSKPRSGAGRLFGWENCSTRASANRQFTMVHKSS